MNPISWSIPPCMRGVLNVCCFFSFSHHDRHLPYLSFLVIFSLPVVVFTSTCVSTAWNLPIARWRRRPGICGFSQVMRILYILSLFPPLYKFKTTSPLPTDGTTSLKRMPRTYLSFLVIFSLPVVVFTSKCGRPVWTFPISSQRCRPALHCFSRVMRLLYIPS